MKRFKQDSSNMEKFKQDKKAVNKHKARIKGYVINLSAEKYYEIVSETAIHPEKSTFYLGLLLGIANPTRNPKTNIKENLSL